jgi:hypothetical protein
MMFLAFFDVFLITYSYLCTLNEQIYTYIGL